MAVLRAREYHAANVLERTSRTLCQRTHRGPRQDGMSVTDEALEVGCVPEDIRPDRRGRLHYDEPRLADIEDTDVCARGGSCAQGVCEALEELGRDDGEAVQVWKSKALEAAVSVGRN